MDGAGFRFKASDIHRQAKNQGTKLKTIKEIESEIGQLTFRANKALEVGNEQEALRAWERILHMVPNHIQTLNALGKHALNKGEISAAASAFQRVVNVDGKDPQQWISLAVAHRALNNEAAEESAIQAALKVDASDLLALIMKADLLNRKGNRHSAALAFGAAAKVAPNLDQLHPSLRPSVEHARQYKKNYDDAQGSFLDDYLAPHLAMLQGENLSRFRTSLDIMVGRKKRYDSQSMMFHYPNLQPIEFFEREEFPWLAQIENGTDTIRDEFINILQMEEGFTPYLEYGEGLPLNQFAELNNSPKWSAFHLYKNGHLQAENAAKCPNTMALLAHAPQPVQLNRTPSAMFSLLKPKTHIPPHTGVSNVRLVTHIPLIIPDDCGLRVGNQTRPWELGKAMIFDDTIEHEAWNNSDKLRVVLIFDIWHPHLSLAEREMVTQLALGLEAFAQT